MKVVICGAGQVGFSIARYLSAESNDVTVIDQSPDLIGKVNESLDVQAIVGHASHPDVLESAGVADADMIIAVTFADEVNMVACQIAHSIFNVPTKIARIRQQSYLEPMWADLFSRDHMPIDVIISPELEVARAISRRMAVPGAFDMIPLADDKVRVIGIRCGEDCPVINTALRQLTGLFPDLNISIVAIVRGEDAFVPNSSDEMFAGDEVYFIADTEHVGRALATFGYEERQEASRRITIIGGGNIGLNLARFIQDMENVTGRIIESDSTRARRIVSTLHDTQVTHGDALDTEILEETNIQNADTVVAVSNDDETNILASLLAKRFGVERTIALVNRDTYTPLVTTLGIDVLVNPRAITVSTILQHIRRGRIRSVHSLRDGFAEVIEAEALDTSPLVGAPIAEVSFPSDVIIGAVVRDGEVIIARATTVIESGDRVILLSAAHSVKKVERMFSVRLEFF
ncbi:MAG: Trk system potassium transporter TrkA [Pseudomonadota bacterium]|nr:Trk system potassium transporter TrkA [Pseudomonadota bacterium]MEC7649576.1 Trk system potassium transporter TrkA [Pseudomonadota bacterium]